MSIPKSYLSNHKLVKRNVSLDESSDQSLDMDDQDFSAKSNDRIFCYN